MNRAHEGVYVVANPDEGGGVQPVAASPAAFDRAAGSAAQTPIQPGELDVTVTVNVTWAIK